MKGRKLTTGRFSTRKELEEYIWMLWTETELKQAQIARNARVSETTVANIIKRGRNA